MMTSRERRQFERIRYICENQVTTIRQAAEDIGISYSMAQTLCAKAGWKRNRTMMKTKVLPRLKFGKWV